MLSLVLNDCLDSSFPDRLDEGSVVTLVLVGIFNRELTNCVVAVSPAKSIGSLLKQYPEQDLQKLVQRHHGE